MNAFSQSGQDRSGPGAKGVLRSRGNLGQLEGGPPEKQRLLLISRGRVCDLILNTPHPELGKVAESGVQLQIWSQLVDHIQLLSAGC